MLKIFVCLIFVLFDEYENSLTTKFSKTTIVLYDQNYWDLGNIGTDNILEFIVLDIHVHAINIQVSSIE